MDSSTSKEQPHRPVEIREPAANLQRDHADAGAHLTAEAAAALTHSENRYRRLFETARDGILLLNIDTGAITDANPFMSELLGYSYEELLGKELWQLGFFSDQEASRAAFEELLGEKFIRYEDLPLKNRNGEPREVEFVSNVYRENGAIVIQCNVHDITARKQVERDLAVTAEALKVSLAREQQVTEMLQRPMLFQPRENAFSGLRVQTAYAMASDEALVGGDFWDTFAFDHGHVAFVLGDVMGHGLTSAIFTTELKHTMRAYIREHEQPARILDHMNRFLFQSNRLFSEGINPEGSDAPVCIALAVIERETGAGTLSLAAMEWPILVRTNGDIEQMKTTGLPLGVVGDEAYEQLAFQLEAGDTLILTTDGITEARQGHKFLEADGLMRLATAGMVDTLKHMAETILNGAREFGGGILKDDASLVLVRRTATSPHEKPHDSEP